jgi:hypothetical protein
VWRPEFVRREIEAIRNELHSNAIILLGSDLDRLTLSAEIAADHGLPCGSSRGTSTPATSNRKPRSRPSPGDSSSASRLCPRPPSN